MKHNTLARALFLVALSLTLLFGAAQLQTASAAPLPDIFISAPDPSLDRFVAATGNDTGNCSDYANPCQTINYAINQSSGGDAIGIAAGTYPKMVSDPYNSVVTIDKSIELIGGWNSGFTERGESTIIDGEYIYSGINNSGASVTISRIFIEHIGINQVGINSGGGLTLEQVSIINNAGQGISNGGNLVIRNSTISQNQGGVDNVNGTVVIENSTIANNVYTYPTMYGGGIRNYGGSTSLKNSIVAGNSAPEAPDCYHYTSGSGSLISNGNNIIGSTAGCSISPVSGDQFNVDPQLSPLLPLGYHPLKATSPALNAGNTSTCTSLDQRGVTRSSDGACDIGAYEHATPGAAAEVLATNAETRRTPIDSPFDSPLVAAAVDALGTPVGGISLNLAAPASGPSGTFSSTNGIGESLTTDTNGYATSSTFTANGEYGDYSVLVTSPGLGEPAAFLLHNGAWLVAPSGDNANDCLSPATPCASISGVLDKPGFNSGETIWVAQGTYNAIPIYYIQKGAIIVGSWDPTFTGAGTATVLHESYYASSFDTVSMKSVLVSGSLTIIGNFVLENSSVYQSELGIYVSSGNLTLLNVTMTGNGTFYPALRVSYGNVLVKNSTITGNTGDFTGGIDNEGGVVTLQNSIIAGNSRLENVDNATVDCDGEFVSLGYNIIGTIGKSDDPVCHGTWLRSDQIGYDTEPIIASSLFQTTPMQDPATGQMYHPLITGSIAVDKVPVGSTCPATDQIGTPRPQGTLCDIGAHEMFLPPSMPTLLSPPSKALLTDFTPTLDWSDATGADHYALQLASDSDFTQNQININDIPASTYTFPDDLPANSTYYWHVQAYNIKGTASAWSAAFYFRTALQPPISIAPGNLVPGSADNIHTRRPTFSWEAVPSATGYTLQVSTTPDFSGKPIKASSKTTTYTPKKDLAASTVYYWRVAATGKNGPSDYSQVRTFTTGNPPSSVKLLLPKKNALVSNLAPTFDWSDSTPIADHYELQLATDALFTLGLINYGDIPASAYTLPADLGYATTYYWHVRACNASDDCSAWSKSSSFHTASAGPTGGAPDGITVGGLRPTFTWDAITGATGYRIQVSTDGTFATTLVNATSTTTSYIPKKDLPAGTPLFWRVQVSKGSFAPGFWSTVWSFSTP